MTAAIDSPVASQHRLPAWAFGLSLAIHLAVLAGPFLQHQAEQKDLPPLAVSFRLPAGLAPAAERASELPRQVPPPPVAPPKALPKSALLAVSAPSAASAVTRVPATPTPVATSAALAQTPATERNEVAPPARAPEANPLADAADQAAMARYVRLLGELLAGQQQYPRLAALRGWEGEVRLRLQVARKGAIIAVHIVHSSGFDVLDQHAVQLVHSATLPPPPAAQSVNGASPDFMIDIPIHYSLKRS